MPQAGVPGGSSVFRVLYSPIRGRRHCSEGTMLVGFDRTTVIDEASRKCVCVVSGTGIRPNPVFTLMEKAEKGATWIPGTEITVGRFIVHIEETMQLHLLPYIDCMNPSGEEETSEAPAAALCVKEETSKREEEEEGEEEAAAAATTITKTDAFVPLRRSTKQLLEEMREVYPHLFL